MLLDLALLYPSNRFVAVGYVGETTTNTKFGEKFVHGIFLSKRMKYTFCDFIFSLSGTGSVSTLWGKNTLFIFSITFGILIIFGAQIHECNCNKTVTKLSTFPNECHYTTLWNTTCVKLFITTVMQALNVMTNWQLRTNTSQQKFGFDTRIKSISPLINCLISDAVLDSDHAKIVSSGTFAECLCVGCVPPISAKCQFPWRCDG